MANKKKSAVKDGFKRIAADVPIATVDSLLKIAKSNGDSDGNKYGMSHVIRAALFEYVQRLPYSSTSRER